MPDIAISTNNSFDLSFDLTFRPELIDGAIPEQEGCRLEGVYLTWLTPQGGWEYWLFEGAVLVGQNPTSLGQIKRYGLNQATIKETGQTMLLQTANLIESEAYALSTLRESVSVYWLIHTLDDKVKQVPVNVPDSRAQLWDSKRYVNSFSIEIELPPRRSQRI